MKIILVRYLEYSIHTFLSINSWKVRKFNEHQLERFISTSGPDLSYITLHPSYEDLVNYASIATYCTDRFFNAAAQPPLPALTLATNLTDSTERCISTTLDNGARAKVGCSSIVRGKRMFTCTYVFLSTTLE